MHTEELVPSVAVAVKSPWSYLARAAREVKVVYVLCVSKKVVSACLQPVQVLGVVVHRSHHRDPVKVPPEGTGTTSCGSKL